MLRCMVDGHGWRMGLKDGAWDALEVLTEMGFVISVDHDCQFFTSHYEGKSTMARPPAFWPAVRSGYSCLDRGPRAHGTCKNYQEPSRQHWGSAIITEVTMCRQSPHGPDPEVLAYNRADLQLAFGINGRRGHNFPTE